MKYFAVFLLFAIIAAVAASPSSSRDSNEDEIEAKILAELAMRAERAARMSPFGYRSGYTKRNSELINSLLGLPKVMTDAGKK